ncbi:MAG: hypothetical protein JXP73_22340 [Deltaproteobacteria bacterium]|nr:hypothetical protein [Deltaproteobacteria bacterium]
MDGEPTLEKKSYTEAQAKQVVLRALRGRGGKLTRADVVALSGLPVSDAEQALTGLLGQYRSHLSATESGELLYEFDPAFARRDAERLSEKLAKAGRALWRGFTFLFKVSIVVTLVAYFLIFLLMLLALIFGRRSGGRSDRSDDDGGFDIAWPLFWMWGWGPSTSGPYGRPRRARKSGKPLYKKVFEFVFGPPHPEVDPLLDEKEILATIRRHRGRIAAVDLVATMGWDFPRADEEATRLLIDYGGEPEVTDDGVVLFVFKDIRKTAQERGAETMKPRRAWERTETRPPLTGNSGTTDTVIALCNGFNLLAPFWIVPRFEARLGHSLGHPFLLYAYPVLFSSMVFAIPAGRWLVEKARDRGRRRRNAKREILRIAVEKQGAPLLPQDLAPDPFTAEVLDASLVALGGDVVPDEAGQIRYAFPRIKQELDAVARARARASGSEAEPGAVVFSSKDRG